MSANLNRKGKAGNRRRMGVWLGLLSVMLLAFGSIGSQPTSTLAATGGGNSIGGKGGSSPEATCPAGGQCFADVPSSNPFFAFINLIYQQDLVSGYACGGPGEPCDSENRPYYRPGNTVTRQQMAKFIDNARHLAQISINSSTLEPPIYASNGLADAIHGLSGATYGAGVFGEATGNAGVGIFGQANIDANSEGVHGQSSTGNGVVGVASAPGKSGVYGVGNDTIGVKGWSNGAPYSGVEGESIATGGIGVHGVANTGSLASGVYGESSAGTGVLGFSGAAGQAGVKGFGGSGAIGVSGISTSSSGYGVYGLGSGSGYAGYFQGNVNVTGNLSKGAGSFKIDDPIDPENKYLYHSFVESPDMMNVYNGNVTLDAKGEAVVTMADWFEVLNRDYRYQLTAVGAPGPNLYIAEKVHGNTFKIAGGKPGTEVSWQVTGIRQDPYANAHRIPVEEEKAPEDKGKYLHPTEWGQPESDGISYISPENSSRPDLYSDSTSK